jgi:hypothetical protein
LLQTQYVSLYGKLSSEWSLGLVFNWPLYSLSNYSHFISNKFLHSAFQSRIQNLEKKTMSSGSALGNTGGVLIKRLQGLFCVMEQGPLKTVHMQAEAQTVSVAANASVLLHSSWLTAGMSCTAM